jgi:hypothetical protein
MPAAHKMTRQLSFRSTTTEW